MASCARGTRGIYLFTAEEPNSALPAGSKEIIMCLTGEGLPRAAVNDPVSCLLSVTLQDGCGCENPKATPEHPPRATTRTPLCRAYTPPPDDDVMMMEP